LPDGSEADVLRKSFRSRTTGALPGEIDVPIEEGPISIRGTSLFAPGAIVGDKYLVDAVLGEGGLGVVVSATHLHLDQRVAIKYLRGTAPRDRTVTERFLREARLAAQIKSEHVVRVFDVATLADGTPYMVMELLEGRDLRAMLEERVTVPLALAIDLMLQACEAVAEAHAEGIVHRDLKPDNIFLARRGGKEVLKILDFGISKVSDKYTSSSRVNVVTQAGDRLGTPLYMSPEQLEGDPNVDHRTDLWALGVVLYEVLTGSMPFTGESLPALCTSILNKTPLPVTSVRRGLPEAIDLVIAHCLAKDREDRYANVAELAQDLAAFGSTASQARVDHIAHTMVVAGETVRPPRWSLTPGPNAHPSSRPPPIDPLASIVVPTPASAPPPAPGAARRSAAVWVGVLALVAVPVFWTLGRWASPVKATAPPPAPKTEVAALTPVVRPAPVPTPTLTADEPEPLLSAGVPSAPVQAPRPTAKLPSPRAATSTPLARPLATPPVTPAPASSDTGGILDPFQ
jgi:serine/threonine-protein kinase